MRRSLASRNRHQPADEDIEGRLLSVLGQLSDQREKGVSVAAEPSDAHSVAGSAAIPLSPEDEHLVLALRCALADLATPANSTAAPALVSLRAALDGAEFVIRGDISGGRRARLDESIPSFVFLVLLPQSGRQEALRVAGRAAGLLGTAS
jgi:hypothetical protein